MINIVIPMAGQGLRFKNAGYLTPKPFIEINGKSLIEIVLDNLAIPDAKYYLLARSEHLESQKAKVESIKSNYQVIFISIDKLTEGSACSVLYAHDFFNNTSPLLIANSDQFIQFDVNQYITDCHARNLDGSILTFSEPNKNPKWSYAKIDSNGYVTEVAEKNAISQYATSGLYYFAQGNHFVNGAIDMVVRNDRVNQEFYTCPVYNYLIARDMKIGIFNIQKEGMYGLGTPEDLLFFVNNKII
jgi:NDP-sugar pyrophosphorylase family protein